METIYKYPFDEAKEQYLIDVLMYDEPQKLWQFKEVGRSDDAYFGRFKMFGPKWHPNFIYKRTEPEP